MNNNDKLAIINTAIELILQAPSGILIALMIYGIQRKGYNIFLGALAGFIGLTLVYSGVLLGKLQ